MTASASQLLQNLPHTTLAALVKRAGFRVESVLLDEGSAYLRRLPTGRMSPSSCRFGRVRKISRYVPPKCKVTAPAHPDLPLVGHRSGRDLDIPYDRAHHRTQHPPASHERGDSGKGRQGAVDQNDPSALSAGFRDFQPGRLSGSRGRQDAGSGRARSHPARAIRRTRSWFGRRLIWLRLRSLRPELLAFRSACDRMHGVPTSAPPRRIGGENS
jgi:hypothetical protein